MEEEKKEYWYYFVREDYLDKKGDYSRDFQHKEKDEALRRARGYMRLTIQNLCTESAMGKSLQGLHNIIFRLGYADSTDGGETYVEQILEEENLAGYLGNRRV